MCKQIIADGSKLLKENKNILLEGKVEVRQHLILRIRKALSDKGMFELKTKEKQ